MEKTDLSCVRVCRLLERQRLRVFVNQSRQYGRLLQANCRRRMLVGRCTCFWKNLAGAINSQ